MASPLSLDALFSIKDLVVVITGGGSGLGAFAAKSLDANGAKAVYIVGRRAASLQKVASQGVNGTIIPVTGDVTDKESLAAVAERVRKEQGYCDVLFANAGVLGPRMADLVKPREDGGKPSVEEFQKAMWGPPMEDWTQATHLNTTAVFYTAVAFLDLLDKGNKNAVVPQGSQILVTASIAGLSRAVAAGFAYSTSKAAAIHLVKILATYFADYKIRVNAIAPGMYPSEMTDSQLSKNEPFESGGVFAGALQLPKTACPEQRTGSERDFAALVVYMVGQGGAYLNGAVMVTDGGRLSQVPAVY